MSTTAYQLLLQSLNERKPCYALYDNLPRYICPHVIGWKGTEEQVLCWQYAGQSSQPLPTQGQWKCLTVSKLSQLSIIDEPWHYGEKGKTGTPTFCVDKVEVQIDL